jgi:hypothetical protein
VATSSCDCCGRPGSGDPNTIGIIRGLAYRYCGPGCRDRHAESVLATAWACELCDQDAVGDTGRCDQHLELHDDAEPVETSLRLAS